MHDNHGDIDNDNRATGYDDHDGADKALMSVTFTRTLIDVIETREENSLVILTLRLANYTIRPMKEFITRESLSFDSSLGMIKGNELRERWVREKQLLPNCYSK